MIRSVLRSPTARFDTVTEVIVHPADVGRLVDFYVEVLGLDVAEGTVEHGFVRFDTDGSDLCVHAGGDVGPVGTTSFTLAVDDIDAARAHLLERGVHVGEIRREAPGIAICTARDPEGNPFALAAPTD